MPGAGSSRRLRAQPAWRASSSDEEARAFLQLRLATYSGVLFAALTALTAFFAILYLAFPFITPRYGWEILVGVMIEVVGLAAVWRVVLLRRTLSERSLYRIDLAIAVMLGIAFACAAFFAPERKAAAYSTLIQTIFLVFIRAFLVPSTGRRTAMVAALTGLPVALAALGLALTTKQDIPGPAFVTAAIVLLTVTVVLVSLGSRLIYGLQRQATAAMQLGQYSLDTKIGEGGMGTVYRGQHVMLRRPTAIKLLRADRVGAETLDRFEREVHHTSQLTHPNTVAVFDFGRSPDGLFYYAMEYLDGIDLEQIVRRHGPLGAARTIEILVQVCGALQEAHDRGIVHRDIKPANIILCEHGGMHDVAKVVDFGLVKEISHDAVATSENILGTPAYVAPETITDPRAISPAADLYALGAVGYFLLSGRRVFDGKNAVELCIQHVTAEPQPLRSVALAVPAELEAVIMRCLCKRPEERFANASALADALRTIETDAWSEELAAEWWLKQRSVRSATPSTTSPTRTITIDVGRRL